MPGRTIRFLLISAALLEAANSYAQIQTGTLVIYRLHGTKFGPIHYSEGETPTIVCDGKKVVHLHENRKTTVSASPGGHVCAAEQNPPLTLDASSKPLSLTIKPGTTTYLRMEIHFGHMHFLLREVPGESGAAETASLAVVKRKDSYTDVLDVVNKETTSAH